MAVNENLLKAVTRLSGTRNDKGVWTGDVEVSRLITRICNANLPVFRGEGEGACLGKIKRVIKQVSRVEVPDDYDKNFWTLGDGVKVLEKFNSKLPAIRQKMERNKSC